MNLGVFLKRQCIKVMAFIRCRIFASFLKRGENSRSKTLEGMNFGENWKKMFQVIIKIKKVTHL